MCRVKLSLLTIVVLPKLWLCIPSGCEMRYLLRIVSTAVGVRALMMMMNESQLAPATGF